MTDWGSDEAFTALIVAFVESGWFLVEIKGNKFVFAHE